MVPKRLTSNSDCFCRVLPIGVKLDPANQNFELHSDKKQSEQTEAGVGPVSDVVVEEMEDDGQQQQQQQQRQNAAQGSTQATSNDEDGP